MGGSSLVRRVPSGTVRKKFSPSGLSLGINADLLNLTDTQKFIIAVKADVALSTMDKLAAKGEWPEYRKNDRDVVAYFGRKGQNRYDDLHRFFRVVTSQSFVPKWRRRWTFANSRINVDFETFAKCLRELYKLIRAAGATYYDPNRRPNRKSPNMHYRDGFVWFQQGPSDSRPKRMDKFPTRETYIGGTDILVANIAPHASSLESYNYVQSTRRKGIMYHIAKILAKRYPQLVIQFGYQTGSNEKKVGLPGLVNRKGFVWAIPFIRVGLRYSARAASRITRPGKSYRKKIRAAKREAAKAGK